MIQRVSSHVRLVGALLLVSLGAALAVTSLLAPVAILLEARAGVSELERIVTLVSSSNPSPERDAALEAARSQLAELRREHELVERTSLERSLQSLASPGGILGALIGISVIARSARDDALAEQAALAGGRVRLLAYRGVVAILVAMVSFALGVVLGWAGGTVAFGVNQLALPSASLLVGSACAIALWTLAGVGLAALFRTAVLPLGALAVAVLGSSLLPFRESPWVLTARLVAVSSEPARWPPPGFLPTPPIPREIPSFWFGLAGLLALVSAVVLSGSLTWTRGELR